MIESDLDILLRLDLLMGEISAFLQTADKTRRWPTVRNIILRAMVDVGKMAIREKQQ